MATVHYLVTGTVKPGQADSFREVAGRLTKAVEANEPDALNYDWHLSADDSTFAVREQFKDDAAFAAHLGNVGPILQEMIPLIDIAATYVLGDVNADSQAALAGFGGVFLSEIVALNS